MQQVREIKDVDRNCMGPRLREGLGVRGRPQVICMNRVGEDMRKMNEGCE